MPARGAKPQGPVLWASLPEGQSQGPPVQQPANGATVLGLPLSSCREISYQRHLGASATG